ncbi:MAG: metallophosphoesterase family protein [Oscillospiraceae bacterium]|jgi:calcineurin-like phosphoesterase family protein|nr:metallophosphoesterase family protein [Oscillospiraceae bacterium]
MIYFTADHHFGHKNIIKHCNRPFGTVGEMDDTLIMLWNKYVREKDTIYILGDLLFRNTASSEEYLEKLNGKKYLVVGNHDKYWMKKTDLNKYFLDVSPLMEINTGQHKITLCHYPMLTWNHVLKGSYMIHGHVHNSKNGIYFSYIKDNPRILNAGVEINNFRPVDLDKLIENNLIFKNSI